MKKFFFVLLFSISCLLSSLLFTYDTARADINILKEVKVATENTRVAGNPGPGNRDTNLQMQEALVSIKVAKYPSGINILASQLNGKLQVAHSEGTIFGIRLPAQEEK